MKSLLFFSICISSSWACRVIEMQSELFGNRLLYAMTRDNVSDTGRPIYVSDDDKPLYLFHSVSEDGAGKWILNDAISPRVPLAYCDSWAVVPHHIRTIDEDRRMHWMATKEGQLIKDETVVLFCEDGRDNTVFLDIDSDPFALSGYYAEVDPGSDSVTEKQYSRIYSAGQHPHLLFNVDNQWILGETPGIQSGVAFVRSDASLPQLIPRDLEWNVFIGGVWKPLKYSITTADIRTSIHRKLQQSRNITSLPLDQSSFKMRNRLTIPSVGLGMGGLPRDKEEELVEESIKLGYRLFDSARVYGNEWILGDVRKPKTIGRHDLFFISKVWPTHLGFSPTLSQIFVSLSEVQSSYLNLYFLHWPKCMPNWEWMNCDKTVDRSGTWRESYRAMERAYAEGRLMSIGVSNFDESQLEELDGIATVLPHVVQNHAEPGKMDLNIRKWCKKHGVLYMPYAIQRNIKSLPANIHETLKRIARERNTTVNAVVLKSFHQTGAVIIPRTGNVKHLSANMQLGDWQLTKEELNELGWTADIMGNTVTDDDEWGGDEL